jgi:hypothetical protein
MLGSPGIQPLLCSGDTMTSLLEWPTLGDWHRAFAEAATWTPHPMQLTKLVWDDSQDTLSHAKFVYRDKKVTITKVYRSEIVLKCESQQISVSTAVPAYRLGEDAYYPLPVDFILKTTAHTFDQVFFE